MNNYILINKMCIFAKFLDKLVTDKVFGHLSSYILPQQHSFVSGRSAVTNLSVYVEYLIKHIVKGNIVGSIYTDLKRAFDFVNVLLLRKLQCYWINGSLLEWFKSFITGRAQYVILKNNISNFILVLSGVCEYTHLGPLLFIIFIII